MSILRAWATGAPAAALAFAVAAGCGNRSLPPQAGVRVERLGDRTRIASPAAIVEVQHAPFRIALLAPDGSPVVRQPAGGALFYDRAGASAELSAVASEHAVDRGEAFDVRTSEPSPAGDAAGSAIAVVTIRLVADRTAEVAVEPPSPETLTSIGARFETPDDEAIYGLTERLRDSPLVAPGQVDVPQDDIRPPEVGSLDRRGEAVEMFIRPTFSLYAPFYQSSRGYGVAVHGSMPGLYDIAKSEPEVLRFTFETGTIEENRRLVFDLYYGPEHADLLDAYTARFGRPYVPPDWAFLNWRWRDTLDIGAPAELDGTPVNAEVADDVKMFDALGIPPGVYHFDRPVFPGNYGLSRDVWDEERLPNPGAMLSSLKRRGYHTMVWSSDWVCGADPGDNGTEAQSLGYLVPGPPGPPNCADVGGTSFILDPTNPAAVEWWKGKVGEFLAREGIDGIKLDRGEEHIPSGSTDIYADGRNGREVHNDYPTLQAKLHYDALLTAHPDGDFVLFSRPGYAGTQRYAIFWGGDIPGSELFGNGPGTDLGLRSAIISQQRAAFMGFPIWGSDTGGYYQFKDREVFARWLEFSAFSGVMEIGGGGTHAPWDMPTDPQFDQQMIDIYRRYTRLRVTLQPYIVAAAREAGARGTPIVRPMPFFDRTDPALRDLWDQYLFGPDLMVAPVWRVGERSRTVYFPRGRWHSYWDDSQGFSGPTTATVDVPLDTIPVFVREGASVPRP